VADWVTLRIDVPAELAEGVANFLVEEGAPGVVTEDGQTGPEPWVRLEAPFPVAERPRIAGALRRYLASLGDLDPGARRARVAALPVPALDWSAVYRRHHRPRAVGRRLLVAPPWDVPSDTDREVLVIEPGMAFGTGEHATTRGCLEAIEDALSSAVVRSALDVGTGSGVLALALARLGVPRVVALDNDPTALPLARATLHHNRAPRVAIVAGTVAALRARFDLVVANLLADALVAEATALRARVAPGGRLIVSGLLEPQAPAILAAYPGWHPVQHRAEAGWQTLVLARETDR